MKLYKPFFDIPLNSHIYLALSASQSTFVKHQTSPYFQAFCWHLLKPSEGKGALDPSLHNHRLTVVLYLAPMNTLVSAKLIFAHKIFYIIHKTRVQQEKLKINNELSSHTFFEQKNKNEG